MQENQLLFLISQPRSGSSLLQQLLLNSEQIFSVPEPWMMLSLIHTYKSTSISSSYNPNFTASNFISFLELTDNGLKDFKSQIKELALETYNIRKPFKGYFLDKTPRYYHILEDLNELFPNAKYVFLVRNPLSVFASMLDYNFNGKYFKFLSSSDRMDDLFLAPKNISNFANKHNKHILIEYEKLVKNPELELKKIFNYLSLEVPKNMLTYNLEETFSETKSIDTKSLKKHQQATDNYIDSWKKIIDTSQKKELALGYLKELQKSYPDYFEYDLNTIITNLKKHKPKKSYIFNSSFELLTKKDEELSLGRLIKKRLILKLQRE
ncbi:sulfotransferase family protein [Hanstruepera ponticola]|uniref:sulfotransferase family protein n=1 Tax=Hanstruepera ponticola TaxID=2042995 RepID=UPI000CF050CE|nr:sulfotransferase [Hanstruepera ponticola]